MELIMVEWNDSYLADFQWVHLTNDMYYHKTVTVGILVADDEHGVKVLQNIAPGHHGALTTTIPRGCITRIRTLKVER